MKTFKFIGFIIFIMITEQLNSQSLQETINDYDSNGKTKLILATTSNKIDEVKTILDNGANVNQPEQKGLAGTPLMYATSTGNVELCKLLLDRGAKVNDVDANKDHALNWATYYGNVKIMKLLIDSGTDLTLKSKHGTAVDVGFRLWHHDSVVQPFKNTSIAKSLSKSEYEIVQAVTNNNIQLVDKLLKKDISVNTSDELGTPILQHATQQGNYQMVNLLIEHQADLNSFNRVGQTALTWAARFGHIAVAELLLNSGADVNAAGELYQLTPLIGAAVGGKTSMTALLLEHNANVDAKDVVNTASALHWAIWYNHKDVAQLLLQHGADFNYKALDNTYSAYDVAKLNKMEDLIKTMEAIKQSYYSIIGSWKLQEIQYQYPDSTYVFKDEDHGRFVFTHKNYALMYNPRMQTRMPFKNLSNPETDEIINAFRSIVFNTGTYLIEDNVICTTADIAKVPGFEGGQQYFKLSHQENTLELIMFDETYPNGNKPDWFGKLKVKFILKKE
jgi:ankyrin repeat protein